MLYHVSITASKQPKGLKYRQIISSNLRANIEIKKRKLVIFARPSAALLSEVVKQQISGKISIRIYTTPNPFGWEYGYGIFSLKKETGKLFYNQSIVCIWKLHMFEQLCQIYSWTFTHDLHGDACCESWWQTDTTWHMQHVNCSFQAMPTLAVPTSASRLHLFAKHLIAQQ